MGYRVYKEKKLVDYIAGKIKRSRATKLAKKHYGKHAFVLRNI